MSSSLMKIGGIKTQSWGHGKNIVEIDVPPQLEKTIPSGIEWFDDAMSGDGTTPSTVIMYTGTPGAGKTTSMLQLADALTATGENIVLYNTGEESLVQVRKVTKRLDLRHGFIAGQDEMVADMLLHADALRVANPDKQLWIIADSLATLDDGFYANGATNGATQVRCAELIASYCKETFAIAVMIGHVTKSGDFAGKNQIKHAIDVHAHIYIDVERRSETYGERIFEVQKNRFGCSGKSYILGMERKGLYLKGTIGGLIK